MDSNSNTPVLAKITLLDLPYECIIKILESIGFIESDYYTKNRSMEIYTSDTIAYWFVYQNKSRDRQMNPYIIKNGIMPYIYTKKDLIKIDPITLCQLSMVSKQFNREFNDNVYWKLLLERDLKHGKLYKRVPKNSKSRYLTNIVLKHFNKINNRMLVISNRKELNDAFEVLNKRRKALVNNLKMFDKNYKDLEIQMLKHYDIVDSEYEPIPSLGTYGALSNQITRFERSQSLFRMFPEIKKRERFTITRQLAIVNESFQFYNPILDKFDKYIDYISKMYGCLDAH